MKTAYTYNPTHLDHTQRGHPENAQRLIRTWDLLESDGILDRLHRVDPTAAPLEAITAVHSAMYVAQLEKISRQGGGRLDADTYVTAASYEIALLSVGGLLNVTDAILGGVADNGFAIVRPPGHHARPQRGMGFCLFGNIAIAARHAQKQYGVKRILIIDFDVHHGNGTQEIFYDDPSVLFFSIHQYPFYPGTGDMDETGSGAGVGKTLNVPFPAGVGDAGYLTAFREILAPLARQHQPELILLSAGYDAHWMDPLAQHQVSIGGFTAMVEESMALAAELCQGRLICNLEGGYNLNVLPHAILSTLRTLSRDPQGISDPVGDAPTKESDSTRVLAAVKRIHGLG
jgi:acetoin utilization deacetylase AcuC-like enzyme